MYVYMYVCICMQLFIPISLYYLTFYTLQLLVNENLFEVKRNVYLIVWWNPLLCFVVPLNLFLITAN